MVMDIRSIEDEDVDRVIDIYKSSYGDDYPYKDFYKAAWVRKGVYSDDLTWLVAETENTLNGSSALMLQAGDHDDLMGEFGRLAVHPASRKGGVGRALMEELDAGAPKYIEFGFAEGRTVHGGSQKLLEEFGFTALGFEPMKYQLAHRESFIYYGKLYGHAAKLRNKRPLIIPQVEELANAAINGMQLDSDIQVDPYAGRYPVCRNRAACRLSPHWQALPPAVL